MTRTAWTEPKSLRSLPPLLRGHRLLAAWVVYLARITGECVFQLGVTRCDPNDRDREVTRLFVEMVPLQIEIDMTWTMERVTEWLELELKRIQSTGAYLKDLLMRYPSIREFAELCTPYPWPVAIEFLAATDSASEIFPLRSTSESAVEFNRSNGAVADAADSAQ